MTEAAAPAPSAVRARGWGWRHSGRRAWAVSDLSIDIDPGERVLILGPSGAGKSTLLHGLAGVLGGDEEGEQDGTLTVDGRTPAAARDRVGLLLQDPDAQVILARVGDDVAFGCENRGVPRDEIWRRVAEALDDVELNCALDHPTSQLSGGQKQRLALAGVLAMRPGLLLLDEPTANLDPAGVTEVRDAVGRVLDRHGLTFVVVEHRVDVWLPLINRVVVLTADGIVADGAPAEVLRREGSALAAQGVWVPGITPRTRARTTRPDGAALLTADELAVSRRRGHPVRTGVNLAVGARQCLALTGPNGAGKSTLGLTLAGLLRPESGEVIAASGLRGTVASAQPIQWKSSELLTRIGTVFQEPEHQFLAATVRDELEVGPRALGLEAAETTARVDELLDRLRLAHLARANPFTLSGGEKRRLSVATALATRPQVLVLDEPTFGQDARTWAELVDLLSELLDRGSAVIAISHDEAFVAAVATHRFAVGTGAIGTGER